MNDLIAAEDEELIMRAVHAVKQQGDSDPWHLTFHPAIRPEWVMIEALVTDQGDIYLHPDWLCPREKFVLRGNLEWALDQPPPSLN